MKLQSALKISQISHLPFRKFDGFENPSQKIDGFGRTHRTHADGATVVHDSFFHNIQILRNTNATTFIADKLSHLMFIIGTEVDYQLITARLIDHVTAA